LLISSQFYLSSPNLPAPINVGSTGQSKEGYLAIGTSTAPSYPLDVAGTIQATGFKLLTGAGADKILTSDASGVASWQTAAAGSLWIQSGTDIYYNDGNVGIGTSTPGALLHVAGTGKFSGVLDMTSQKITSLATPTADTDAATKGYVDAQVWVGGVLTTWGYTSDSYPAAGLGAPACPAGWTQAYAGWAWVPYYAPGSTTKVLVGEMHCNSGVAWWTAYTGTPAEFVGAESSVGGEGMIHVHGRDRTITCRVCVK